VSAGVSATLMFVGRRRYLLGAIAGIVALLATSCLSGSSASTTLAGHLIATRVLEQPPWDLRIRKAKSTGGDFGIPTRAELGATSGSPPTTAPLGKAKAVVTRQWNSRSTTTSGPLPEGIASVIDIAAQFPSAADARTYVGWLYSLYPGARPEPVADVPGATVLAAPLALAAGTSVGHEDFIVVVRVDSVFVVTVAGGGSRPNPSDFTTLASLQSAAATKQ
jgi:hypothetical protein